jgi:hypothetical protein
MIPTMENEDDIRIRAMATDEPIQPISDCWRGTWGLLCEEWLQVAECGIE